MRPRQAFLISISLISLSLAGIACSGKKDEGGLVPVAGAGGNSGGGNGGGAGPGGGGDKDPDGPNPIIIPILPGDGTGTDPDTDPNVDPEHPSVGVLPSDGVDPGDTNLKAGEYVGTVMVSNDLARSAGIRDREMNISLKVIRSDAEKAAIFYAVITRKDEADSPSILDEILMVAKDQASSPVNWRSFPSVVDVDNLRSGAVYGPIAFSRSPVRFTELGENHFAQCTAAPPSCVFQATHIKLSAHTGRVENATIKGFMEYNPTFGEIAVDFQILDGSSFVERIVGSRLKRMNTPK